MTAFWLGIYFGGVIFLWAVTEFAAASGDGRARKHSALAWTIAILLWPIVVPIGAVAFYSQKPTP